MMYDDKPKIPQLMENGTIQDNLKLPFGILKKTNIGCIKNNPNTTMRKRKSDAPKLVASFTLGVLLTIGGAKIGNSMKAPEPQPSIPSGYILTEIKDKIESGDTITSIANEYYDEETYSGMYPTALDYTTAILEQNELEETTTIHPGETISIPVVIHEKDEIYTEIKAIESAIAKIKQEDLWVDYVLQAGDGILDLAAKASGSIDETYSIAADIRAKNKDCRFWDGDTVSIMNPKLGQLKTQLRELQEQLQQSLSQMGEIQKTR